MKRTILYAMTLYAVFIGFGFYLKTAHGEHYKGDEGGFPSSAPGGITGRIPEPGKPCREYLSACEKSCAHRGDMFRFLCLGPGFNPESQRYRCQCGDEAFVPSAVNIGSSEK